MGFGLLRVPFFGIAQYLTTPRVLARRRSASLRRAMIFRSRGVWFDAAVVRDHESSLFLDPSFHFRHPVHPPTARRPGADRPPTARCFAPTGALLTPTA